MSETIETIPKAQTSVQTLNGTSLMNLVIKQESTGAATSEEGEEEEVKPCKNTLSSVEATSSCLLDFKNHDEYTDQKENIISIKEEQTIVLATKKSETKCLIDTLADDNEKENNLKQDTNTIAENAVNEEIIDGFSFLTFEYESDLKVIFTAYTLILR